MRTEAYTLASLYDRMRAIMFEQRIPVDKAIPILQAEIAADPEELAAWWEAMGAFFLKSAEAEVWRLGGPSKLTGGAQAPARPAPRPGEECPAEPRRGSWKTDLNPLDVSFPVGTTGVVKRLGDWNRADILAHAECFHANARRIAEEGDAWISVAGQMTDGETLEDAVPRIAVEVEAVPLPAALRVVVTHLQKMKEVA